MTTVANADTAISLTKTFMAAPLPHEAACSIASFARPADATPYAVGDVVSVTGAAAALIFPGCGAGGFVVGASLVVAETDTADFDLFLFDAEPTNFADNAPLALVAADQPKLLGVLRFLTGAKVNVGTNLEIYRAVSAGTDQAVPKIAYVTTAGSIYGLLVTRSVYTPISACKFVIRLGLERNG